MVINREFKLFDGKPPAPIRAFNKRKKILNVILVTSGLGRVRFVTRKDDIQQELVFLGYDNVMPRKIIAHPPCLS